MVSKGTLVMLAAGLLAAAVGAPAAAQPAPAGSAANSAVVPGANPAVRTVNPLSRVPVSGPGYLLLPTTPLPATPVYSPATLVQPTRPAAAVAAPSVPARRSTSGSAYAPSAAVATGFVPRLAGPAVKYSAVPPTAAKGPPGTYKLHSLSGERLYLDGGLRVRLAGIQFPAGAASNLTRRAIKDVIRTHYLYLYPDDRSPPRGDDNYRAWLFLPDGRSLQMELLAQGAATLSATATFRTTEERDQMQSAQQHARTRGIGIWAAPRAQR